jgi:Zn-dependent peptidase ImmA (M78 family)
MLLRGRSLKTIRVDQGVFESRSPYRYRFSLAHELGHTELHRKIYEQIDFSTIDEWKAALKQIPEHLRSRLEFQAYDFAGLFLVPLDALRNRFEQALKILERAKVDVETNEEVARPYRGR